MKSQKEPQVAGPAPLGTLTMFLTDVEGSTKLWEKHRTPCLGRSSATTRSPMRLSSDTVATGRQTRGRATASSRCSRWRRAPWPAPWTSSELRCGALAGSGGAPVRVALHTGALDLRDGRNYAGLALNRCARLRAIAHGGQVLLSEVTRALTALDLPAGASLQDLGITASRFSRSPSGCSSCAIQTFRPPFLRSAPSTPDRTASRSSSRVSLAVSASWARCDQPSGLPAWSR